MEDRNTTFRQERPSRKVTEAGCRYCAFGSEEGEAEEG